MDEQKNTSTARFDLAFRLWSEANQPAGQFVLYWKKAADLLAETEGAMNLDDPSEKVKDSDGP